MRALSVTFLIPVFGVLWGAVFLGETVGWSKLFGGNIQARSSVLPIRNGGTPRAHLRAAPRRPRVW